MKAVSLLSIAAILFGQEIEGHGYVQQLRINGAQYFTTWNPYKHPQVVGLQSISRKFLDNGPVTDGNFLNDAIICNYGAKGAANNVPAPISAPVPAGAKVEFLWTPWESDHPGPVMTYIAKCPGKCSDFAASSGNIWVKIDQAGYDASQSVPWASKRLPFQNSTWPITLPSTLVAGEYILRHEILGLQRSIQPELAQFYPACHQIVISGGGSTPLPAGIALPGAYTLTDPGISLQYRDISASKPYTPPGGPVWGDGGWSSGPAPQPTSTPGPTSTIGQTTAAATSSSTKTTTAKTSTKTTTKSTTLKTSTKTTSKISTTTKSS